MKRLQITIMLLLLLGLGAVVLWQRSELKQLSAQSAALRDQLAQAMARVEQTNSMPNSISGARAPESPSSELLRLRGEVGVLKRQLAEAIGSNAARKAEPAVPAQAQPVIESELSTVEAHLQNQEKEAETARQTLMTLMTALQLPLDASADTAAASLSAADLQSYRDAKRAVEETERLLQVLRLKVAQVRAQNGASLQPPVAR